MAFVFLLTNMTAGGMSFFGPTIVSGIYPNYSVIRQQLMTVVSISLLMGRSSQLTPAVLPAAIHLGRSWCLDILLYQLETRQAPHNDLGTRSTRSRWVSLSCDMKYTRKLAD